MKIIKSCLLGLAVVSLLSTPALAKKDHGNKGKNVEQPMDDHGLSRDDHDGAVLFRFDDNIRGSIQAYMRDDFRSNCPPGLAKKRHGCLPPGQAKKYRIGDTLPPGFGPIPEMWRERLGPPPHGAFYAMVDQDVLLVSEATKKILDAVTLLSAVK